MKVDLEDIKQIVKHQIKSKKFTGYDLITPEMMKNLPNIAFEILVKLFNAILKVAHYPTSWKISQIILIAKSGNDLTLPSSYRTISLLPCLSKLFEIVLQSKIKCFLNSENAIPNHQFGFREKHGTVEQVDRVTSEIRKCFEQKKYCSAVFLDVAQAFDKVWHEGLTYKIKRMLPLTTHNILRLYIHISKIVIE